LALIAYADASLLVSVIVPDAMSPRAHAFLTGHRPTLLVSDFGAAEFVSAVARRVRTGELTENHARAAFAALDAWIGPRGRRLATTSADIVRADALLRRLDLPLRTPDALHIAIAERHRASLATFDRQMTEAAKAVGLTVAPA
jgi:predicted nucleic acid-binding protein